MTDDIGAALEAVRRQVREACERAGRDDDVVVCAVCKTVTADRILRAYGAGQRVYGENRVQEGAAKVSQLTRDMPDASWHLLGHLQTNKAKQAVECFDLIEAVDSVRLATKLDSIGARLGSVVDILLEVNVAAEASKSGFLVEELRPAVLEMRAMPHVRPLGLMTVAPLVAAAEDVRWVFRELRRLRDEVMHNLALPDFRHLSMGMSNDFGVAVEEGATIVRVGRAIFGERPPLER